MPVTDPGLTRRPSSIVRPQEGSGDMAEDEWSERRRLLVVPLVGVPRGERDTGGPVQRRVDNAPPNALNFSVRIRRFWSSSPERETGGL